MAVETETLEYLQDRLYGRMYRDGNSEYILALEEQPDVPVRIMLAACGQEYSQYLSFPAVSLPAHVHAWQQSRQQQKTVELEEWADGLLVTISYQQDAGGGTSIERSMIERDDETINHMDISPAATQALLRELQLLATYIEDRPETKLRRHHLQQIYIGWPRHQLATD